MMKFSAPFVATKNVSRWTIAPLEQIGRIVMGKTPPTNKQNNYGGILPFVTPTDMDGRRIIEKTLRYLSEEGARCIKSSVLNEPAILVSCIGSDMGKTVMTNGPCATNQQINSIIVSNNFDRLYLYYNLSMRRNELRNLAGGTAQPILNKVDFGKLQIKFPPLYEQQRIASILNALDDKIEINHQMNETLEAIAQAIFKDWFLDFGPTRAKMEGLAPYLTPYIWSLFPDRLDDKGKPEGWETGCLENIADLQNGFAFKSTDWQKEGVPVVKIGSIKPAVVDLSQVSFISESLAKKRANFKVQVGDVLVGLTGCVGETSRVPPSQNLPLLNQRVARFIFSNGFCPFVYSYVRGPKFKEFAKQTGHGSAQVNVSTKDLLNFPILRPRKEIVAYYKKNTRDLYKKNMENIVEINELVAIRDLLLPKLMSGEIQTKDAKKIVDEAL